MYTSECAETEESDKFYFVEKWFLLAEAGCVMSNPSIAEVDNKSCFLNKNSNI